MSLDQTLVSKETIAWLSSTIGQKSGCAIFAKYYFILHLVGYAVGIFVLLSILFLIYAIVNSHAKHEAETTDREKKLEIQVGQYSAERELYEFQANHKREMLEKEIHDLRAQIEFDQFRGDDDAGKSE